MVKRECFLGDVWGEELVSFPGKPWSEFDVSAYLYFRSRAQPACFQKMPLQHRMLMLVE